MWHSAQPVLIISPSIGCISTCTQPIVAGHHQVGKLRVAATCRSAGHVIAGTETTAAAGVPSNRRTSWPAETVAGYGWTKRSPRAAHDRAVLHGPGTTVTVQDGHATVGPVVMPAGMAMPAALPTRAIGPKPGALRLDRVGTAAVEVLQGLPRAAARTRHADGPHHRVARGGLGGGRIALDRLRHGRAAAHQEERRCNKKGRLSHDLSPTRSLRGTTQAYVRTLRWPRRNCRTA